MAHSNGQAPLSPARKQPGPIRRFFNGWKRLEEAMDYSPYDYVSDRLRLLEARVIELESQFSRRAQPTAGVVVAAANKSA